MASEQYGIGVDLGGTKLIAALVDSDGRIEGLLRYPTDLKGGPSAVEEQIAGAVRELKKDTGVSPVGIGVGVAGQIAPNSGVVKFGPNLGWHDVPLGADLQRITGLPVVVTNDVRAATWGEWLYGAGKGCNDIVCVFVGTGIGGGIVSGGRMLGGCSNTAGEVGHITIDIHGPVCHCGNRGCFESLAGGWAIAERARQTVFARPHDGVAILRMADGDREKITGKTVSQAFRAGDLLARHLVDEVSQALVVGSVTLVNAFNPCRLIFGGGVIEGLPELVERVDSGVRLRALAAATGSLEVVKAQLGNDAGAIGAAALAMRASQAD